MFSGYISNLTANTHGWQISGMLCLHVTSRCHLKVQQILTAVTAAPYNIHFLCCVLFTEQPLSNHLTAAAWHPACLFVCISAADSMLEHNDYQHSAIVLSALMLLGSTTMLSLS